MKLDFNGALKQIGQRHGVWILQGDEPLLTEQILSKLRHYWQKQGIERLRLDLNIADDWLTALDSLNNQSLFAQATALVLQGNAKPTADTLQQLEQFNQHAQQNMLVVVMPKQDSAALKTKFFKWAQDQAILVNLGIASERERHQLIQKLAETMHIVLTPDAWRELFAQTHHNLLAAQQVLLRLTALCDTAAPITLVQLKPALIEQSRFSSFDLGDALLRGQASHAIEILNFLQESDEPVALILWAISREMKLLLQLSEQPYAAEQLGIWSQRQALYTQALRRLNPDIMATWPDLLRRTDEASKGFSTENPWNLLLECVMSGCGHPLFFNLS